jgi:hypothetical protein
MTTIRQLIQNGPAKANELFAKLGDTSDTAVKTRERLFTELKEELELLARLEEEHIFPVLRKNKTTKSLVPDALNDNKLTRKLLAQLEEMPKDSDEFTDGLADLRRTFQQHVRDEKKELLPAVLKALSDEETPEPTTLCEFWSGSWTSAALVSSAPSSNRRTRLGRTRSPVRSSWSSTTLNRSSRHG